MLVEYTQLRNEILKLGYMVRRQLVEKMNMRDYIYKETSISQSQFHKLEYIPNHDQTLFIDIGSGKKTIREVYLELRER